MNLDDLLIPEPALSDAKGSVKSRVTQAGLSLAVDLDDGQYGNALQYYLLLTHWPYLLGESATRLDPASVLYNRYYWFLRFAHSYCAKHGRDAGLEQQAFQILEGSEIETDWSVLEKIEARVRAEG